MKEGVFQQSVEILEDYILPQVYSNSSPYKSQRKNQQVQIKIRMQIQEDNKIQQPVKFKNKPIEYSFDQNAQDQTLSEHCRRRASQLVYMRFHNQNNNILRGTVYFASLYINLQKIKGYKINSLQDLLYNLKFDKGFDNFESSVRFDSKFESGNLFAAFKKQVGEYDLILQNDINSKGNIQWFYFSVQVDYPIQIKFNILNMMKYDSLFNYGMYPVIFSIKKNKKTGEQWFRGGKKLFYQKNNIKLQNKTYNSNYYTFSFTYQFKSQDKVYFAYHYPYTYSRLNQFLYSISNNPLKSKFCKRKTIGHSILNIGIQCLTIAYQVSQIKDNRRIILIIARQHPGETVGSWISEGFIQYLLKKSKQAEWIKKNYIIKVIPMINPDGVLIGNYRCNLSGYDLNRRWDSEKKIMYPEIIATKAFIKELIKDRRIVMMLDLHGHSKKMQTFFYGNYNFNAQIPRSFPFMASKISNDVNFESCVFTRTQDRKSTARMYLSSTMDIPYAYTYQSSFYGGFKKNNKYIYDIDQYKRLGGDLVNFIYHFYCRETQIFNSSFKQLCQNLNLINLGDRISCSESSVQIFQLKEVELEDLRSNKKNIKQNERKFTKSVKAIQKDTCKLVSLNILKPQFTQNLSIKKQIQNQYIKKLKEIQQKKKSTQIDKQSQTQYFETQQTNLQKPRIIKTVNSKLMFTIQKKKKSSSLVKISNKNNTGLRLTFKQRFSLGNRLYQETVNKNNKGVQTDKLGEIQRIKQKIVNNKL